MHWRQQSAARWIAKCLVGRDIWEFKVDDVPEPLATIEYKRVSEDRVHFHPLGVISLALPAEWKKSVEDDMSVFYREAAGGGTFRVVCRHYSKEAAEPTDALEMTESVARRIAGNAEVSLGATADGYPIAAFEVCVVEDNQDITMANWVVCRLRSETELQLNLYTYSVLSTVANSWATCEERSTVDAAVRGAEYWDKDPTAKSHATPPAKPGLLKRLFGRR